VRYRIIKACSEATGLLYSALLSALLSSITGCIMKR